MKGPNIFISFIGSRGSGKTTVAKILAKNLEDLGFCTTRQHLGLVGGITFKNIFNALILWRYFDWEVMKKIGFCGRSKRLLPSLYRIYLPLAFMKDISKLNQNNDVLIYDSNFLRGMMQGLLSHKIESSDISIFYKSKILPNLNRMIVVVIDTDPKLAISRWIERDNVNITEEDVEKEIEERDLLQKASNKVVNVLLDLPKVQVIRLKGEDSPEKNVKKILYYFDKNE
jgi:thymidylate kinase